MAHLQILKRHAEEDLDVDAVCMRLSAGIEALAALDATTREEIFGGMWPLMWGMRNRIAHGDLLVDAAIVRQTVMQDVPSIMSRIWLRLDTIHLTTISEDQPTAAETTHDDMPPNDSGTS
jgi:uncharacterized protein with HEPN domain